MTLGSVPITFWFTAEGPARKQVASITSFAADANIGPDNETDHRLLSGLNLRDERTGRRFAWTSFEEVGAKAEKRR